jgi:hypothetical protein
MTPFRNDAANPWSRESIWPGMPQAPLSICAWSPRPAPRPQPQPQPQPMVLEPGPQSQPTALGPQPPRLAPQARRELRLTPLIGAAAVGAGGLLALFLLIGVAPMPAAPAQPPARPASALAASALAVGEPVGEAVATAPVAAPTKPALASALPRVAALRPTAPASSIDRLELPAPETLTTRPAADTPAPSPPAAAAAHPAAPPDRDAPISRRLPDAS